MTQEEARNARRAEIESKLTEVVGAIGAALGQPPDPAVVKAVLDEIEGDVQRIAQMTSEQVAASAASSLRALADSIEAGATDTDMASLGRRIDSLIERLERDVGPRIGHDPEAEKQRLQAEYDESARSAIAASLRAAGIKPLTSPAPPEEK